MSAPTCTWCGEPLASGRQPKRFCSSSHRNAFHDALRLWATARFDAGEVTVAKLREFKS